MNEAEINEIEDLVNRYILENEPVTTNMMAIEEAMQVGAVAMFGEKYGAEVRVLSVGDGVFSKELCGGTHVRATGDIGSVQDHVRRSYRVRRSTHPSDHRFRLRSSVFARTNGLSTEASAALKTQRDNLPNAIERLQEEAKTNPQGDRRPEAEDRNRRDRRSVFEW